MTVHREASVSGGTWQRWKQRAQQLKREVYALYLAYKDPRVPRHARIFAAIVVGYAFSPIDLIPDPIPILGYLDDLVLLPLGIALLIKIIPAEVLRDSRVKAAASADSRKPKNWIAGSIIIAIWVGLIFWTARCIFRAIQ